MTEDFERGIWRFRNYAGEVTRRWKPGGDEFYSFLELAVVDAHDAAIDAMTSLVMGAGAPALSLYRRFFEIANILFAGWEEPAGLKAEMERALKNTRLDDHYAGFAERGVIGAVMPNSSRVRKLLGEDPPGMKDFEQGVQSIGHGGMLASMFYVGSQENDALQTRLEHSLQLVPLVEALISATAAASWQILERLGYPSSYQGADARFSIEAFEAADDAASDSFDKAFPRAFDVIWSVLLGMSSISISYSEAIGSRGYDPKRRQAQLISDCFETGCLAMEFLYRGRLAGCATLTRRVFEMSLELQAWVRFEREMNERFQNKRDRERTPSATSLIGKLHGSQDSANQRRTYSTLCSAAHGGMQAQEYLLDGDWKTGFKVCPAPVFAYRHHRWLLGTLISSIDAALGGALLVAGRSDSKIAENHGGYLTILRRYTENTPELGLIRHEEADFPDTGS